MHLHIIFKYAIALVRQLSQPAPNFVFFIFVRIYLIANPSKCLFVGGPIAILVSFGHGLGII